MFSRRQALAVGGLALVGGAGCVGDSATGGAGAPADATTTDATTAIDDANATDATTTTDDADRLRITVADGDGAVELATGDDVAAVGEVRSDARLSGHQLPLTLTDEGTETFLDGLERVGAFEDPESHRIRTYFDGELLYEARLGTGLADAMESGEWDGRFLLTAAEREAVERVEAALEGELATTRKTEAATARTDGETTRA